MISISPLNAIRFQGVLDYDFELGLSDCYFQKYQTGDSTWIQVRSDEEEVEYRILDARTRQILIQGLLTKIDTVIADQSFKIYQTEISFNILNEGFYLIEIGEGDFTSRGIHIKDVHENTLLIRYRNSLNDFGVIFDTDIVFDLRVEAQIDSYTPKSDNEIYNDQRRNATKLYGLPYNTFTFYVGGSRGVPDWMLDTVNRAFSCDMIRIGDNWFEQTPESEWEVNRIPDYPFAGMSIEIMPSSNNILERLRFEDDWEDLEDFQYMIIQRYSNNYTDVTGILPVTNVFQRNMVLNYITVFRKGAPYELNIGTTPGGSELGTYLIEQPLQVITLNYKFLSPSGLYLSGMTQLNDVSLVWDKVDRFFNPLEADAGQESPILGKGALIHWHGTEVEFETQFNVVTGLGRDGGDWYGWAIANGQNGTLNMQGKVLIGWSSSGVYNQRGSEHGADNKSISVNNLPPHHFKLFGNASVVSGVNSDIDANSYVAKQTSTTGRRDEKYAMRQSSSPATVGRTNAVGSGQQFNVVQSSRVALCIQKIM